MKAHNVVHGGDVQRLAREYGFNLRDILDYSSNINPLPLPNNIDRILLESLEDVRAYPDREYFDLRSALSCYTGLPVDYHLVGNGATELIYLIARAIKPEKIVLPVPSFAEYEQAFNGLNTKISFFPLDEKNDFKLDEDKLIKELTRDCEMLILCNPNNPSGQIIKKKQLQKILKTTKEMDIVTLLDETFVEFTPEKENVSMLEYLHEYNNLIILRALTKFFAVPGMRLGYCIAQPEVLEKLKVYKEPWTVNVFAEKLGIYLLNDKEFIDKTKDWILNERSYFYHMLDQLEGYKVFPSYSNFFLMKIQKEITQDGYLIANLKTHLEKKGIMIRDCSSFRSLDRSYFRIAIKERKDNLRLLESLREWMGFVLTRK